MSEFHDQIARYRAAIEAFLQAQFCQELPQKRLFDAMRYSLLAGGKRIRPVLTLEFCRICGGDWQSAVPFACALEMVKGAMKSMNSDCAVATITAAAVSPITRSSVRRWLCLRATVC